MADADRLVAAAARAALEEGAAAQGLVFKEEEEEEEGEEEEEEEEEERTGLAGDGGKWEKNGTAFGERGGVVTGTREVSAEGAQGYGEEVNEGTGESEEDEDEDGSESVEWACKYCGIEDPECVVRCIESGFWFCNGSGKTTASHIIHHLVRSKNKEICLHPEGPLGETIVECYNCKNRNVLAMGFIPAKGETVVVLLCRSCLNIGAALKELDWDLDSWTPLVQDRALVPWLVKEPEEDDVVNAVTTAQINKLEDMWKKNPVADLDDLEGPAEEDDLEPVSLKYDDGFHYKTVFDPLVALEAEHDREMKGQMQGDNVSLRWKVSEISGRITAILMFSASMSESMRITIGDELMLTLSKHLIGDMNANVNKEVLIDANTKKNHSSRHKGKKAAATDRRRRKDWECTGTVIYMDDDGEISLELRSKENVPLHVENGYSVSFVWKPITFDRMQNALKTLANVDNSLSGYLFHKLMGHTIKQEQTLEVDLPSRFGVKGLPELNESQVQAVRQVLRKPLALIQGPPGTGKTVTSASLVYHIVKQNKGAHVLVTAPSNVAVDHLTEKIHQTGLRVVRLAAKSRENIDTSVEALSLHHMIVHLGSSMSEELKALLRKREDSGNQLNNKDMRRLMSLRKNLEGQVLANAEVICCTCSGAGDPRLAGKRFDHVLLDEATQATEPESLIPIVKGCKQFVLVGDHCQLGPVVMCKKAAKAGLNSSLFERLVSLGLRPIRLAVQYRMHPCLSEFPSNTFYEGSLENGVSDRDRVRHDVQFPWINPQKPMMFYVCMGNEEMASTGTSFLNRNEAANCERVVTTLLRGGARPDQIGVVTPYEGQRAYIVQHLQRAGTLKQQQYKEVEVSSVDAFQGREKDYIILSCVRSNTKQGIGFLNDPRRLNVALTRAKYGLVILGNPKVLAQRPLWNGLLVHFRDNELLVEGPLGNLQVNMMKFPKSKKYYRDRRQRRFDEAATQMFSGDASDPFGERESENHKAPNNDSRHDPRYGGATHARVAQQGLRDDGDVLERENGVAIGAGEVPLPDLRPYAPTPAPVMAQAMGKGFGDFDYANAHQHQHLMSPLLEHTPAAPAFAASAFSVPPKPTPEESGLPQHDMMGMQVQHQHHQFHQMAFVPSPEEQQHFQQQQQQQHAPLAHMPSLTDPSQAFLQHQPFTQGMVPSQDMLHHPSTQGMMPSQSQHFNALTQAEASQQFHFQDEGDEEEN